MTMTTTPTDSSAGLAGTSTTAIKPGLLVVLRTSVNGGVRYERTDLPADAIEGKAVARWETKRVIEDPEEYDRANKARMAAMKEVRRVCAETIFGLLCPESDEAALNAAHARAREIAAKFNEGARFSVVTIYMLKGRVASTDEEAARAISAEVSSLLRRMNAGIDAREPEAIRKAAAEALQLAAVLSEDAQLTVSAAVESARKAARTIVKRAGANGLLAAVVIDDIARGPIEKARIAFLDTSDDAPALPAGDALPSVEVARVAALDIDLEPDAEPAPSPTPPASRAFEIDEAPRAL